MKPPDAKYAIPRDTDRYGADLAALGTHESSAKHGKWWVLDEWAEADKTKANALRRKLVKLYGAAFFQFKVLVAADHSSTALLVRFDPPVKEEVA